VVRLTLHVNQKERVLPFESRPYHEIGLMTFARRDVREYLLVEKYYRFRLDVGTDIRQKQL